METTQIHLDTNNIDLMRSLSIGWYVEGWAHSFAFCNNCDNYHTVSQGPECGNGHSIMHRTNAQTNYLYIPDPEVPVLSPQPSPVLTAAGQEPAEEPQPAQEPDPFLLPALIIPNFVIYDDDNETISDDEDTAEPR